MAKRATFVDAPQVSTCPMKHWEIEGGVRRSRRSELDNLDTTNRYNVHSTKSVDLTTSPNTILVSYVTCRNIFFLLHDEVILHKGASIDRHLQLENQS